MIEHAYIHIPFCLRKCAYCSFVSGENIENKEIYLKALFKEINLLYKGEQLKTLYIGGGTPSLLSAFDISKIIKCFNTAPDAEITLEANPETVSLEKFKQYKYTGINRVSLGIQTFDNEILRFIKRGHTAEQAADAVFAAKTAGFNNISIDLIYGLPFQTLEKLENDLEQAEKLDIQHISAYGLKIEEGSFFYKHPPENLPDDTVQADMYKILNRVQHDRLGIQNEIIPQKFNHYEISSYARAGFESRHNTAYWLNKEYYGFGLNASGYEGRIRYRNTADFAEYINNPLKKEEIIELSDQQIMENEIFLALRLKQGINIKEINSKFNIDFTEKYKKIIEKYKNYGLLEYSAGCVRLTEQGFLLSSEIMSEFIDI